MTKQKWKITIEPGANVWPHELKTAYALAEVGQDVDFIKKSEVDYQKTADTYVDKALCEFKAPKASNKKAIERNVRRALEQSSFVVFDSQRMKGIPDRAIEQELRACASGRIKNLKHLVFVNRKREVIDIL